MPLTMVDASLAQTVKQKTAILHQEVEALLLPKLESIQSTQDYIRVLQMFYGYFSQVEEAIQQILTSADLTDIHQRRTASLILNDLRSLGEPSVPRLCTSLPVIQNKAQAFGALYVLEGSTLGGRMIAKMLAKNVAYPVQENALRFFQSYGSQTGVMWTGFIEVLNRQNDPDVIVHTANQTFLHLKNWMLSFYESASES